MDQIALTMSAVGCLASFKTIDGSLTPEETLPHPTWRVYCVKKVTFSYRLAAAIAVIPASANSLGSRSCGVRKTRSERPPVPANTPE